MKLLSLIGILLNIFPSNSCPIGWHPSIIDENKCYLVVNETTKQWFEAEFYCQTLSQNAHLTSIHSAFETALIDAIVFGALPSGDGEQLWIGLNDVNQNGTFVWFDGTTMAYSNWMLGEPDLRNQCVSTQAPTTGKWKTEPCGTQNRFICETFTTGAITSPATSGAATSPAASTGQPPCTPPTTSNPTLPCQANFALLVDTSNGTTAAQFAQQQQFIVQTLFQAGWTYSQWAIANYDSTFLIDVPYASLNRLGDAQRVILRMIFQSSPPQVANIANALQKSVRGFNDNGAQPCLQQKTILFTSTSDPADVQNAIQWAEHVQALGDLIVVSMGPNVDMTSLTRLASPNSAFNWPDYTAPPSDLATRIIGAFQC